MKLSHLSQITGVSERNIKRYVYEHLLPPPVGRTKAAAYGATHVQTLLRIKSLRDGGLTLGEIRQMLADEQVVGGVPGLTRDVAQTGEHAYRADIAPGAFLVLSDPP